MTRTMDEKTVELLRIAAMSISSANRNGEDEEMYRLRRGLARILKEHAHDVENRTVEPLTAPRRKGTR